MPRVNKIEQLEIAPNGVPVFSGEVTIVDNGSALRPADRGTR